MNEKETQKIQTRFQKLLTGTVFEEQKDILGRILGLATEDELFEKKEE